MVLIKSLFNLLHCHMRVFVVVVEGAFYCGSKNKARNTGFIKYSALIRLNIISPTHKIKTNGLYKPHVLSRVHDRFYLSGNRALPGFGIEPVFKNNVRNLIPTLKERCKRQST